MEERRKNKRISLEGKILIKRLDSKDSGSEANIEIVDASRTGIGFNCKENLTIGAVYKCKITLWTKEVLDAFIEIVRMVEKPDNFMYGAIFIGMPDSDLDRISVYETVNEYTGQD